MRVTQERNLNENFISYSDIGVELIKPMRADQGEDSIRLMNEEKQMNQSFHYSYPYSFFPTSNNGFTPDAPATESAELVKMHSCSRKVLQSFENGSNSEILRQLPFNHVSSSSFSLPYQSSFSCSSSSCYPTKNITASEYDVPVFYHGGTKSTDYSFDENNANSINKEQFQLVDASSYLNPDYFQTETMYSSINQTNQMIPVYNNISTMHFNPHVYGCNKSPCGLDPKQGYALLYPYVPVQLNEWKHEVPTNHQHYKIKQRKKALCC